MRKRERWREKERKGLEREENRGKEIEREIYGENKIEGER